ncbi:NACHT domain-containing protein [Chitinophaga rupis]|uniref:NACHT domain-containing protein n=1 Tax=Chitinophaga rupis TaxID=573321 RepID=A0A1H8EW89_9BACT|nr:NACHT domain-containing protein [Chitinophaga rupis]SEN23725.1 NACHT domain-containing protein [Chitinophaga rupis]
MEILTLVTSVVGNKLKSLFEGLLREFGEEVKQVINNNILEYQIEEYNRNYCTKTLLHRVQPKNLKDFYQPLFITTCDRRQRSIDTRDNSKRIPTNSIRSLFTKKQFITLIGSAGSGKSTIVKYLFLNSIDTNFKIPIKVELRYLNDYEGSVIEFIKSRIFKLNRLATNDRIIERLMNSGDFVFFLDGYDEINSLKKEKITKEIDDLVKLYNKNFYLLTSRPYTEIDLLPLFHNFEVCELSDRDINNFIKKQIPGEEEELCDKIIEAVNSKENISYKSFLSNPLLLSMFILTFQSYSNIPQKRSEFYSQVFDALFSVHDSMSKLAFVREKQSGLSKEQIVDVLKLFSFISYFDEKFIFSNIYLEGKFKFIKEKKKSIAFDNNKLINDFQVAIGILNKEGTDYAFPHRSLQEYFAAIYIFSLNDDNKKIVYKKIIDFLTDRKIFRQTTRDNFHLLLSELDEKNVIKYALIPYFEKYIQETNLQETKYEKIIDNFLTLDNVFEAFYFILKSNETSNANKYFGKQFDIYRRSDKMEISSKANKKKADGYRQRLAIEEIQPFLKNFLPRLKQKKQELTEYLINESKSDSEIVSII